MSNKKTGHHSYFRHSFQLLFSYKLCVNHHRPTGIFALSFFQLFFKLGNILLRSPISVAVCKKLLFLIQCKGNIFPQLFVAVNGITPVFYFSFIRL